MNTNDQAVAAQQPPNHGNNRGRGGRGGGRSARNTPRAVVAKQATAKVGPNRLLETEWVKDASLADASFVYLAVSGKAGDQQWTFHRPIGETSLDARDWVATPTRDITFLLQRKENEALAAWKRQSELAKRQAVLSSMTGRRLGPDGQTEVWTFENAPAIQPTIRTCMAAAKAAGANESTWLTYADRAVQTAEQTFKEALRNAAVPPEWIAEHPRPHYETKGGALGDVPQTAVEYLKGLSLASARDKVTRVAIGLDQPSRPPVDSDSEDDSSSEDESPEQDEEADDTDHPPPKKASSQKGSKSRPASA